jgi:hypothetical protein
MAQVCAAVTLLLISALIFCSKTDGICIPNCNCYENSKLITCEKVSIFPSVPRHGIYHTMIILNSILNDYSNLNEWTSLRLVSIKRSTFDCSLLSEIRKRNIDLEIDNNHCLTTISTITTISSILSKSNSMTPKLSSLEPKLTSYQSELSSTHSNFSQIISGFFTTIEPSMNKENRSSNYRLKYIIGGSIGSLCILILFICGVRYFWKKKGKVSRLPPNLPTGSQLDVPNPSVSIEMDSFDSFEFHSSIENIYEIPNPIYSNV